MQDALNTALEQGLRLERTGLVRDAVPALEAGLRFSPGSVPGLLALSRALAGLGRFEEAAVPARRATDLDPGNVSAHVQLGSVRYSQDAFTLSWESYQRALDLDPTDLRANHLGSFTLDRLGRSDQAAELAARAVAADPLNADMHLHLGNLLANTRDDAAAERAYRRALAIGAPRLRTLVLLAGALARQQRLDEARAAAREATALAPDDPSVVALCHELRDRPEPARQSPGDGALLPPSRFLAANQEGGKIVLFAPLLPPPQLPLLEPTGMPAELREEHDAYAMPPPVTVHVLSGFQLRGIGLFRRDEALFDADGVLPPYLRPHLCPAGPPLPEVWAGTLYRPDAPVRRIDVPCFSPFHPNLVFGHFLLEMYPKLYLWHVLRACGDRSRVLLPAGLPSWARGFVDLFAGADDVMFYDAGREAVEAPCFVLASMMHTDHNFHPAFNLAVDHAVRVAASRVPADRPGARAAGGRRLYLSRRRASTAWHAIVNEQAVEEVFAELGFEVIHPQELTVVEQICTFAEAGMVAGEFSSALHNTIFSPAGTRVIALNRINWYQSRIGRLRQQPILYIPPADGVWRDWRARKDRADFAMDCAQVRRAVARLLAQEPMPSDAGKP